MRLPYEIWDVFTEKALSGNPLAVISDASDLTEKDMQAIAREFNLSETSFILPSEVADLRARYFTPVRELPMAGHPSVGTIFSAYKAGQIHKAEVSLELGIGIVPMKLDIKASELKCVWMGQGVPQLITEVEERASVARALGLELADLVDTLPVQIVSVGNTFMLVPLDSLELLGKAKLDLDVLPDVLPQDYKKVFVFTFDAPDSDIRARMFGEALGVREDPATGSAHGPLGWYVAEHELVEANDGVLTFTSHQGVEMGRPSELSVRVTKTAEGSSVEVGGYAVKVAEGELWL